MAALRDWRDDPLVRIEKLLYAVAPALLRASFPGAVLRRDWDRAASDASEGLRQVETRYMAPFDIVVPEDAKRAISALAGRIDAAARAVAQLGGQTPLEERGALADDLGLRLPVEVEGVMDHLRATFVQTMLSRQAEAARRADEAAREVAQVSRMIYFISINATVEAARVGDVGRGFAVIGAQIRDLSEQASASLRRMRGTEGRMPR